MALSSSVVTYVVLDSSHLVSRYKVNALNLHVTYVVCLVVMLFCHTPCISGARLKPCSQALQFQCRILRSWQSAAADISVFTDNIKVASTTSFVDAASWLFVVHWVPSTPLCITARFYKFEYNYYYYTVWNLVIMCRTRLVFWLVTCVGCKRQQ